MTPPPTIEEITRLIVRLRGAGAKVLTDVETILKEFL
jgi:hypothetical protein